MKLALYKGPPTDWQHKIAHWAVCTATGSIYSHCELVIGGVCWSASARDGAPGKRNGVRGKVIDLASGRWDVIELPADLDEAAALAWFQAHNGSRYDWAGVFRFVLPLLPHRQDQWFCSEACGAALGIANPHELSPATLAERFTAGALQGA